MSEDIDQARRRLSARLDELSNHTAQLRRFATMYQERAQDEHDEVRRELSEYAQSADAPPELRRLRQQIDRGELSWDAAVLGGAGGIIDAQAGTFLAGRLAGLAVLGEALRSGASVGEAAELAAAAAEPREAADAEQRWSTAAERRQDAAPGRHHGSVAR